MEEEKNGGDATRRREGKKVGEGEEEKEEKEEEERGGGESVRRETEEFVDLARAKKEKNLFLKERFSKRISEEARYGLTGCCLSRLEYVHVCVLLGAAGARSISLSLAATAAAAGNIGA